MEEWQRKIISKILCTIIERLDPNELFFAYLEQENILTSSESRDLQSIICPSIKNQNTIDLLQTRTHGFNKLYVCLRKTDQELLSHNLLEKVKQYDDKEYNQLLGLWEAEKNTPLLQKFGNNFEFNPGKLNKLFTGRLQELRNFKKFVKAEFNYSTTLSKFIVISGKGSIGKTQFSTKYCEEYREDYTHNIIWLNASSRAKLIDSFIKLSDDDRVATRSRTKSGEPKQIDTIIREVFNFFSRIKCLFLYDNADEKQSIADFLPTGNCLGINVILTSKLGDWEKSRFLVFPLQGLLECDAVSLVKCKLPLETDTSIGQLVSRFANNVNGKVFYYPLALRQVIACISAGSNQGIQTFMRNLDLRTVLDSEKFRDGGLQDPYEFTMKTVLEHTLQIVGKTPQVGELAQKIFSSVVYLDADDIPLEIWSSGKTGNEYNITQAINLIKSYFLIEILEHDTLTNLNLSIHRVEQDLFQSIFDTNGTSKVNLINTLKILNNPPISSSNAYRHGTTVWNHVSNHEDIIKDHYSTSRFPRNVTPLHLLSDLNYGQHVNNVKKIVNVFKSCEKHKMAIINVQDDFGRTPFWIAASSGNIDVVKYLASEGACMDSQATYACFNPSENNISFRDMDFTPLHIAARNGHAECVTYIKKHCPSLCNAKDSAQRTPAVIATSYGRVDVVKILKPGDDVYYFNALLSSAVSDEGVKEFKTHVTSLSEEKKKQLLNTRMNEWAIIHTVAFDTFSIDFIKFLVIHGANVTEPGTFSPLHCAANNGRVESARYFVEKGAHPTKDVNDEGWTALHAACQNGQLNIVEYFVNKLKCDVNVDDNKGDTPLITASFHGKIDVVKYLVDNGAKVNWFDRWGITSIMSAALTGHFDIVDHLWNKCPNILLEMDVVRHKNTLAGRLNLSVLHVAVAYNHQQLVKDFVEKGIVSINVGSESSFTPLHVAVFFNREEMVRYLIQYEDIKSIPINLCNIIKSVECDISKGNFVTGSVAKTIAKIICSGRFVVKWFISLTPLRICYIKSLKMSESNVCKSLREFDLSHKGGIVSPGWLCQKVFNTDPMIKYVSTVKEYVNSKLSHEEGVLTNSGVKMFEAFLNTETKTFMAKSDKNINVWWYMAIVTVVICIIVAYIYKLD